MRSTLHRGDIGEDIPRLEDERLLRGEGRYVSDLRFSNMLDLAVLRSPYAHAKIESVDAAKALLIPGIVAASGGAVLHAKAPGLYSQAQPPLAADEALFVGQPVAFALGEDRYVAEDALEKISVRYRRLPVLADAEAAVDADPEAKLLDDWSVDVGEVDGAVASADVVIEERLVIGRATAQPLEGRATVAVPQGDGITVYAATQAPHSLKRELAEALSLPPERVRVIAPDVGGGFGVKDGCYPEDLLACHLALQTGRPVRFIEDRREHFVSTNHSRAQVLRLRIAAKSDGALLAVDADVIVDAGAYLPLIPYGQFTLMTMPGPYHLPAYRCRVRHVMTHKVPAGPYRGAGRPEGNFAMERLMDRLARTLDMDVVEVRRRNLIRTEEMPYDTGVPNRIAHVNVVYDSGDYPATLEKALEAGEVEAWRKEAARPREDGRRIGVGIALFVEDTGVAPFEVAVAQLDPDGRIRIATGSPSQGQGHQTTQTQIACTALRQEPGQIVFADTDTAFVPAGIGTFGSRGTVMGGSALLLACQKLGEKILGQASALLGERPETLEIQPGRVTGRSGEISLRDVAVRSGVAGDALRAETQFRAEAPTYANGAHVAVCAVDPETGGVEILRYVAVEDCGRILSPRLVDGQIQGGISYGVSGALLEELVYDAQGQLLTGSFMDYPIPTVHDVPAVAIHHLCSPSPRNPLGVKGVGEAGTIPALAAIASAVEDALAPFGAVVRQIPLTPERVQRLAKVPPA